MPISNGHSHPAKVRSLREMQQAMQPPRDLWPDIQARLPVARSAELRPSNAYRLNAPWTRAVVAAASIAVLAVGIWIGRGTLPVRELTQKGADNPVPSLLFTTYNSDPQFAQERAELLRELPNRIAALPPESQAQVTASLSAIHKAMQDIETALGRDSGNALLQELFITTCQDEMRVLTAVHEASNAGKGI